MQTETQDNIIIEFSNPGVFSEPITVRRTMPDNSVETIGHVYQNWSEDDVSITYECRGLDGEEICITADWIEAEKAFEKYAKHYHEKSQLEQSIDKGEVFKWYSNRENEIGAVREGKGRNKNIGISK